MPYGYQGPESPLLGPYLRAKALAQQMREQQMQEERHNLQVQLLRQQLTQRGEDQSRQATDRLLELAMQGIEPFKQTTRNAPQMEAAFKFIPEKVVSTPEGAYKVPTKEMRRKQKLDELRDTYRAKQEIESEFDPIVDYEAGGKTYKIRQSKLSTLIDDEIRAQRGDSPTLVQGVLPSGELGYAGINRKTGEKLYEGSTGLIKPTTPEKPSEKDYEREAEDAELGGKSPLVENPDYVQLSNQYKEAFFKSAAEDNQPISWEEAWKQADEYIRRKHKGVDRYIDVRKTPEFQQSVNRRIMQMKGERGIRPSSKTAALPESVPASKLEAIGKLAGYVDKQGRVDINRVRRTLALKKIKIDESK